MIRFVYSVYDVKACCFQGLWFAGTDEEAKRCFAMLLYERVNQVNPLSCFPEDFVLYKIGTFDLAGGLFESLDQNVHVIAGSTSLRDSCDVSLNRPTLTGGNRV